MKVARAVAMAAASVLAVAARGVPAMGGPVRRRRVLAVALGALLLPIVAGCAAPTLGSASAPAPVASASLGGAFGGSVHYQMDGAPATTEVDAVASGANVSGTAVSELGTGTHTVQLECAIEDGDTWAVAGKTEQTTVPGERAGDWSAVIVKDGSPQHIGIWLSAEASDCGSFLGSIDIATIDLENFQSVESGAFVPPPDSAP